MSTFDAMRSGFSDFGKGAKLEEKKRYQRDCLNAMILQTRVESTTEEEPDWAVSSPSTINTHIRKTLSITKLTNLLRDVLQDGITKVAPKERAIGLRNNAVLSMILYDVLLLTQRMQLV
jgi:hypothetical protein